MRVASHDASHTRIISLRPVRLPLYLASGLLFISLGVFALWLLGWRSTLECRGAAGGAVRCDVARQFVLGKSSASSGRLGHVAIEERWWLGFVGTRDVRLTLDGQPVMLYLLGDSSEKVYLANQLQWLLDDGGRGAAVQHQEDRRLPALVLGVVLVLGGGYILWAIERIRIVVNRRTRDVSVTGRGGAIVRRAHVRFDDIRAVVKERTTVEGATSFNVALHLKTGGATPIARAPLFTEDSANETAALIRSAISGSSPG